jgi:hypothetical protein
MYIQKRMEGQGSGADGGPASVAAALCRYRDLVGRESVGKINNYRRFCESGMVVRSVPPSTLGPHDLSPGQVHFGTDRSGCSSASVAAFEFCIAT